MKGWMVGEVTAAAVESSFTTRGLLDHILLLPRAFFGFASVRRCLSVFNVCFVSSI